MLDWKYSDKLIRIANALENARKEIYVHSKLSNEDYEGIDDELFKLQSDIRIVAEKVQANESLESI